MNKEINKAIDTIKFEVGRQAGFQFASSQGIDLEYQLEMARLLIAMKKLNDHVRR